VVDLEAGPSFTTPGADGAVTVIVRPEAMTIGPPPAPGWVSAQGRIAERVFLGPMVRYAVRLDSGEEVVVQIGDEVARPDLAPDAKVTVAWPVSRQSVLQA